MARTSAPTCAAAPATSRSSTPSRPWPRASRSSRRSAPRSAAVRRQVRGRRAGARRPRLRRRHPRARACCTPRCTSPTTPAPTSSAIDTTRGRGRPTASSACSPPPTSPASCASGIIYKDWPVMIPVGGRTSYAGDVLAIVVAETRAAGPRRGRARRRRRTTCCRRSPTRWRRSSRRRRARRVGHRRQRAVAQRVRPRRRRRRPRRQRPHRPRGVPDPAHRARLPRAGVDARRAVAATATSARCTCTPAARACGTTATTSAACSASATDRVTVELVSNGGAFGGKEDMSNQAHAALAAWLLDRPVKCTLSREESFRMHAKRHPIRLEYWAGCDADGMLTAVRVRAVGDSGAYASVGMKVLERAAGHATGPYHVPAVDVEADRGAHQQPGVRRVPRVRRQPGAVRDGRRARPAGRRRSASAAGRSASAT